jgi:hypothetical protein
LNPQKCIFVVELGRLLRFIVSNDGISVDPLNVEAILGLTPPKNMTQLQILQRNESFLHPFISNYTEITKGFMILLQKCDPFIWDETAQCSFDALKRDLQSTPLLHPLNYEKDYILYLDTSTSTISMVLVQEDDDDNEHVIYYLSKSLSSLELRYSDVEKLSLETFIVIQIFHHYIVLKYTMVLTELNHMYHILISQVLGGKYSKWIVILQEFDLEFTKLKDKKSFVFAELICDLPHIDDDIKPNESLPDESLFLISMSDPWYGYILLYLQTQCLQPSIS